ncbi:MAG: aminotransferase class I/II-fold pyridoxal phosphate-dependent enzyme, partial [Verrucomicrobia bacterium]|nr:aminotransferase class I/II-fold pyridoxal phosphate-dependent enzyme [Verrucomicrobiota bacterium]
AARAVEIVQSLLGDELRNKLRANINAVSRSSVAAILPLIIGDESSAMQTSAALLKRGFLIPAIRYPTVARGSARLRLTLSAAHEAIQIESLVACLHDLMPQLGGALKHSQQELAD